MSDVKKTIKINPEIFNIGTRKNREKKKIHNETPHLISPNILKNKLLKRIKEHKISENTEKKKEDIPSQYSDEFTDSIEYLQSLSKQKKNEDDNARKKQQLLNRTIRNNNNIVHSPHVELDLPEELQPVTLIHSSNYKVDNVVPYGCLKGGYKPTFRDLNKTRKVYEVNNPSETLNISSLNLEREQRLNALKEKAKSKQLMQETPSITSTPSIPTISTIPTIPTSIPTISTNTSIPTIPIIPTSIPIVKPVQSIPTYKQSPIVFNEDILEINPDKQLIKKTCKRKYILGKSKVNRSVGILIKDNKTRKNIINAQKELKHHSISDIKKYLHKHNLIKSGSNAPNDVIRKLYESCMLAGEITNLNKETLLHNFAKEPN
jgi:hypothetical protein